MKLPRILRRMLPLLPLLCAATCHAQATTPRTLTMVVGYPAGAGTDVIARTVAEKLSGRLQQAIVVDNKAGASGTVGVQFVAKAPADGNTLLVAPNTVMIAPHVLPKGSSGNTVDVLHDLVPVARLSRGTMLMVASPALGAKNAKDLVAMARKQPGITYASPGSGSPMHIAGEMLKQSAQIDLTHVPYKGSAPAMTDLIGGHVQTLFGVLGSLNPHIQAGRMVPLGVLQKERSPLVPELPTMAEQGIAGMDVGTWYGVFAPRGTSPETVERLNREINAVLALPEVQQNIRGMWEVPAAGSSQEFAAETRRDYEVYGKIVREFRITAD